MRIATYRTGGHRSVGRLTPDGKGIQPFEPAPEEARRGALALLDRLLPGENLPSGGPAVALDRVGLIPGDIIATGTPAGVGIGFDPPKYLKPGDSVRIEIAGIGVLENPVARFREAA